MANLLAQIVWSYISVTSLFPDMTWRGTAVLRGTVIRKSSHEKMKCGKSLTTADNKQECVLREELFPDNSLRAVTTC